MSSVPTGFKSFAERHGRNHRPKYRLVDRSADGWAIERDGARTKFMLDGKMMRWATAEWVSQEFLDACKSMRDQERRAPRGDSTGCWQECARVPMALLIQHLPFDAWGDEKAVAKVLNNPEVRFFRTDGNHRRL